MDDLTRDSLSLEPDMPTQLEMPGTTHAYAPPPDDHHHDLFGPEAVYKIREVVSKAECGFLVTQGGLRPMSVRETDDDGNLWFLSAVDSRKNRQIAADDRVELYFQASEYSGFMHLVGHASILHDRDYVARLWTPLARAWFTEGRDDPRISVIRFRPTTGQYWDDKHGGDAMSGLKMLIGAALGTQLNDGETGELTLAS